MSLFTNFTLATFAGPYASTLFSIDACIGSHIYSRSVQKLTERYKVKPKRRQATNNFYN